MLPFLVSLIAVHDFYHPPISRQTQIKFAMATSAFVHFIIYCISYKTEAGFKGRHFLQLFTIYLSSFVKNVLTSYSLGYSSLVRGIFPTYL